VEPRNTRKTRRIQTLPPKQIGVRVFRGAIYENSAFSTKFFPLCFLFPPVQILRVFRVFRGHLFFLHPRYLRASAAQFLPLRLPAPRQVFRGSRNCLGGDLEHGRYQTYDNANVMQLAEDVSRTGRERMTKNAKNPKTAVSSFSL
jgi:hypothetical protein